MTRIFLSKYFLSHSQNMICLGLSVEVYWCICMLIVLNRETSWFCVFDELLDFATNDIFQAVFKRSYASFHVCTLRNDVKTFTSLEDGEGWNKKIFLLKLELIKVIFNLLIKIDPFPDWYFKFFRLTSMPAGSNNFDLDNCDLTHDRSIFTPDFTQGSSWPLMASVNFINSIKTAFLDHEFSTGVRAFLWWLEK